MDARSRGLGTLLLLASVVFTMGCAAHRYDAHGHYYEGYDHRHAATGAVLGGLAGAGVGRVISGHRHDEAGYWIGGALGALTGAVIGDALDRDEAARRDPYGPYGHPAPPPPRRHDPYPEPEPWYEDHPPHRDHDDDWYDEHSRAPSPPPEPLLLSLPDEVLFAPASDALEAGAERRLRAVAKAMRDHPGTLAVIRGHASRDESREADLSDARARAVRAYLLRHGIAPSRVTALGMGARFPVASDHTPEGRQRNRRAEIEIKSDRGHDLAGLW